MYLQRSVDTMRRRKRIVPTMAIIMFIALLLVVVVVVAMGRSSSSSTATTSTITTASASFSASSASASSSSSSVVVLVEAFQQQQHLLTRYTFPCHHQYRDGHFNEQQQQFQQHNNPNRNRIKCGGVVACTQAQKQQKVTQRQAAATANNDNDGGGQRSFCSFFSRRHRAWSKVPSRSAMIASGRSLFSSSTSALSSSTSTSDYDDESSMQQQRLQKRKQMMITFCRCLLVVGLFATGFWTGVCWYNSNNINNSLAAANTATKATAAAGAGGTKAAAASTATATRGPFFAAASFLDSIRRNFPIMSVLLVVVVARDVWRNVIPNWAKPRLIERSIQDTKLLLGIKQHQQQQQSQMPQSNQSNTSNNNDKKKNDDNDIGDIDTLIGKINAIKTIMTKTIDAKTIDVNDDDADEEDNDGGATSSSSSSSSPATTVTRPKKKKKLNKKPKFNLGTAFFTYQNLIRQFKEVQHSPVRDMWYQQQQQQHYGSINNNKNDDDDATSSSAQQIPPSLSQAQPNNGDEEENKKLLKRLPLLLDMADWAYDEDPSGKPLKQLLKEQNYTLVKHDKTPLPGYLGHYVAIPTQQQQPYQEQEPHKGQQERQKQRKEQKRAVIGVKGTSGLEDFMTDLCGASVELDVTVDAKEWTRKMKIQTPSLHSPTTSADERYDDDGNDVVTIRAHEGVAISSRRLADDLKPIVENLLLPQDYKLTIVGHSLGAAGASLLSVILCAEIPSLQPSQLEVFAFASPPTLDLETAKAVESFTTTIVNNNDVIPRMNVECVGSTVDLLKILDTKRCRRDDELDKIRQTYRQQHRWWYQRWRNRSQFVDRKKELMDATPLVTDMEYLDVLYNVTSNSHGANVTTHEDNANPDHLYVPGKVVLLYKSWSNGTSKTSRRVSKAAADKAFDSSSTSPQQHIIMSNIDGTKDTQTTTTLAEVAAMTSKDDDGDGDGTLSPSSSTTSLLDRVVFCETTSPPIRILELDPTLLDDHMTDGYRRSLQSVLSHTLVVEEDDSV